MKQPSICIIIPYFGQWPVWMPYFVLSCSKNATIHWMLYTDCGEIPNCPENMTVFDIDYASYCDRVSEALKIDFQPSSPYKLCDIKPCLGLIHQQELAPYDFWAFGDIDVVYGDLRHYFTTERLAKKDLFSTHARRLSGHLCLMRNNEQMRHAFKRVKNWQQLLSQEEHVAFDEKNFSKLFLRHKNSPKWYQAICKYLDPWLNKGEFVEAYSTPNAKVPWIDGSLNFPERWIWENGQLAHDFNDTRLFPYFHFFSWKNNWGSENMAKLESSDTRFVLNKNGITC